MKIARYLLFLILLSIITTLCCAQILTTENHETGIEEAKQNLEMFLSSIDETKSYTDVNIISADEFSTPSGDYYQFETEEGNFKVNKKTGTVESAWFYQDDSNAGRRDQSIDQSLRLAEEFARKHYLSFENLNMVLTNSEKTEGNNGRTKYLFKWYEIKSSLFKTDVYTSNYVFIAVEAGEITGYIGVERETEVSLNPALSEDEAIIKGLYAVNLPEEISKTFSFDNKLSVCFFDGKQHLAWVINIDAVKDSWGYAWGGQAIIDAHDGTVLLNNPYL